MIELFIAIIAGTCAGIITGLIPGVHINLISLIVVALSPKLLQYTSPMTLIVFIVSMAITHTFLDFIPSVFLGVPDAETALSILPGHKMVLLGQGFEAVKLTVVGSLMSIIFSIVIIPLMIFIIPRIYTILKPLIGYILIAVVLFLIFKEKSKSRKFWSFFIFATSGILGLIVLNFPNIKDPLLPMLSGLFGLCMLFNSLEQNTSIPIQRITEHIKVKTSTTLKSLSAGTFAGSLTGFFPGLGASQASIIGSILVGGMETIGVYGFLILQGAINTVNFALSLITLYTIEKARNGAIIAVMKIFPKLELNHLLIILTSVLITAGLATYLAMWFARLFSKTMSRINYKLVSWCIIILIIAMSFYFSGLIGLLVLFTSTMLGLIPIKMGLAKNHAMGCLLLPVIIYFVF